MKRRPTLSAGEAFGRVDCVREADVVGREEMLREALIYSVRAERVEAHPEIVQQFQPRGVHPSTKLRANGE
jgi:hypothetical protein